MRRWFIYALRDPLSWEVRYVGKASDPVQRLKSHLRPRARTNHRNARWIRSLATRGLNPLLDVIDAGSGDGHPAAERAWIAHYRRLGAQLTNTGDGGLGFCDTPETRSKISATLTGKKQSEATKRKRAEKQMGRRHSAATREKCAVWQRGVTKPAEHVANMAAAKRGKPMHEDTRAALQRANTGRTVSPATREKIAESLKGHGLSEETRRKIADALRGRTLAESTKEKCRAAQAARRAREKLSRSNE